MWTQKQLNPVHLHHPPKKGSLTPNWKIEKKNTNHLDEGYDPPLFEHWSKNPSILRLHQRRLNREVLSKIEIKVWKKREKEKKREREAEMGGELYWLFYELN